MPIPFTADQARQCLGKRPYARKRDAKIAVRHVEQRHGRMIIYRCPHCDRWHLGHRVKR